MKVALISPALIKSKDGKISKILNNTFQSKNAKGKILYNKLKKGTLSVKELCCYISGANYFTNKLKYGERYFEKQLIITPLGLLHPDHKLNIKDIESKWIGKDLKNPKEFTITEDMIPDINKDICFILIGSEEYLKVFNNLMTWNLFYPLELRGKTNVEKSKILNHAINTGKELTYQHIKEFIKKSNKNVQLTLKNFK